MKKNTFFLLISIAILTLASMACGLFPFDWNQWDFGKPPDDLESESSALPNSNSETGDDLEQPQLWDINRCNALAETTITLEDFSEERFTNSDGSEGGTECAYTHRIQNTGKQAVRLIYYDHFAYGDNPPPNDYEFGWNKTGPIAPRAEYSVSSFLSSYPKQPLYRDQIFSIAAIYDDPGCAWIVADGVHFEVLQITEEEPILAPCQEIDPFSGADAVPDLTQGLIRE